MYHLIIFERKMRETSTYFAQFYLIHSGKESKVKQIQDLHLSIFMQVHVSIIDRMFTFVDKEGGGLKLCQAT